MQLWCTFAFLLLCHSGEGVKMENPNPLMVGALLVTGAIASIGAVGAYVVASRPEYAQVVRVDPVRKAVTVLEQECKDARVVKKKPVKDQNRIAGTVIGGMVGGVIGHQFGSGTGNTAATIAGAAGGAVAGNQIQKKVQEKNTVTANERQCRIVNRTEQQVVAYDVRYRLDGKLGTVRMDHEPGQRIPVRDGRLVLSEEPAAVEKKG
jgi:uncharacterized protein YcfJ